MTIEELMEVVPEDKKEGVQQLLQEINPLSKVQDADSAAELIANHDVLKKGRDKLVTSAIESHKKKFEEEKLPELRKSIRDEVSKELNPEETPEQKRLRELEQQLQERENREKQYQLKEQLRSKAKELDFDEDLAERFVTMNTEDPASELEQFANRFREMVETRAEKEVANRWPNKKPRVSPSGSSKITSVDDIPEEWTPEDYARAKEAGQIQY